MRLGLVNGKSGPQAFKRKTDVSFTALDVKEHMSNSLNETSETPARNLGGLD